VTALRTIQRQFNATSAETQWIMGAYLLAVASLMAASGRLADLYGRRRLFIIGAALFGLGSIGCAAAPSEEFLIAARAIQGCGGALLMPGGIANATATLPEERRGWAVGIVSTGATVYLTLYLQHVLGYSPAAAGALTLPMVLAAPLVSAWVGRTSDRLGTRRLTAGSMAACRRRRGLDRRFFGSARPGARSRRSSRSASPARSPGSPPQPAPSAQYRVTRADYRPRWSPSRVRWGRCSVSRFSDLS
jgi:predicted MFS family arabinose efflux permease